MQYDGIEITPIVPRVCEWDDCRLSAKFDVSSKEFGSYRSCGRHRNSMARELGERSQLPEHRARAARRSALEARKAEQRQFIEAAIAEDAQRRAEQQD